MSATGCCRVCIARILAGCAVLATLLYPPLTFAQASAKALAEASLEDLVNVQVFSASKHLQSTTDAPSSVTIITAEEINRYGYRTLADALASVRGFYLSSDRDYEYLGVRGFSRPGDYNTRVLLLIDGHRLNDSIYDQAMLGTEFPLDIDLVDRIEVVRGPASSLYGSNAFFAVINVVTRTNHELQGLELSFAPSSFDTYKGRVSYGSSFGGLHSLLSATVEDSAGPKLFFPEFNSPATNNGFTRFTYDRYHQLLFTGLYHRFTLQALDGFRDKAVPTGAFGSRFNDPRNRFIDHHQYLDLTWSERHWQDVDLFFRTYYDRYGFDGAYVYPDTGLNFDYARGQTWGAEAQLSHSWHAKHHIVAGSEFRDNFQQDQKNYDISPSLIYLNSERTSWVWAGYLQYECQLNRHLSVMGGLRQDQYSIYGARTSPRTALVYKPAENTALKFLFGEAFRTPNVYEAFYGSGVNNLTGYKLNPALQAEDIRSFEGVFEQQIGKRSQLSVSGYRNVINNLISIEKDTHDGLLFFANIDSARSTGLEVELAARPVDRIQTRLSYACGDADNSQTGDMLTNSPQHVAKLRVSGSMYRERLFASLDAQYTSWRMNNWGSSVPGFPIFNLTILGKELAKNVELSGSLYNVFGRRYFDPASAEQPEERLQGDGRSFRFKLTWRWGQDR